MSVFDDILRFRCSDLHESNSVCPIQYFMRVCVVMKNVIFGKMMYIYKDVLAALCPSIRNHPLRSRMSCSSQVAGMHLSGAIARLHYDLKCILVSHHSNRFLTNILISAASWKNCKARDAAFYSLVHPLRIRMQQGFSDC